ncbi:MAG: hypothetical protein ACRENI_06235 [Gemmatimonadaceae bacterium]
MTPVPRLITTLVLAMTVAACDSARGEARGNTADNPSPTVIATHVDSAAPIDELLRRFRADAPVRPERFTHGARSREELVTFFAHAVRTRDSSTFGRLMLSRAEFAWLYYPTNPVAVAPYELDPALMWFRIMGESEKGLSRLLPRLGGGTSAGGGRPAFTYIDHACPPEAEHQGENRIWGPCSVRYETAAGDTAVARLFGAIVERGDIFKFVSYANKM